MSKEISAQLKKNDAEFDKNIVKFIKVNAELKRQITMNADEVRLLKIVLDKITFQRIITRRHRMSRMLKKYEMEDQFGLRPCDCPDCCDDLQ